ncbi:MAG: RtcB family protein [Candidatus ainarchaeum sp.]|nr:RtcB family protein [Candidatus ainarchaeum sp.]MDD3084871.1 RtcB family protein [Candidatus ainarchaeum sp.]MDD4221151.1 RtcB family protein [Candidatus ainarchaeum sp.]
MVKYILKENHYFASKNGKEIKIICSKKLFLKIPKSAFKQLENISLLPNIISPIIALPDIHPGFGVPIGSVFATLKENAIISSEAVGYDINCGVRLIKTNLYKKDLDKTTLQKLANNLKQLGLGLSDKGIKITKNDLNEILLTGVDWAIKNNYCLKKDKKYINYNGVFKYADYKGISKTAMTRAQTQVGTLGQGNHFIDIVEVTDVFNKSLSKKFGLKKSQICIFLHSGSRGLGHQVATDYNKKNRSENKDVISYLQLDSKKGNNYYRSMLACANYAFVNRSVLSKQIEEVFKSTLNLGQKLSFQLLCDNSHNLATLEKVNNKEHLVHRKGASRVFLKEDLKKTSPFKETGFPVLLPGSMLDYSYVLVPDKGVKKTFYSVAHGSGRKLNRIVAKEKMSFEKLEKLMEKENIILAGRSQNLMREEQPLAYKPSKEVLEIMEKNKLVKKVIRFIPVIVLTG